MVPIVGSAMLTKLKLALVFVMSVALLRPGAGVAAPEDWTNDPAPSGREREPSANGAKPPQAKQPRLDLNGDPLPEGAVARLGSTRLKPGQRIDVVAFLPD